MITKSNAEIFTTQDGTKFYTREDAQKHAISKLEGCDAFLKDTKILGEWIIARKDELLAILSTRKQRVAKVKQARVGKTNRAAVNEKEAA